jgi:hypothetical protein
VKTCGECAIQNKHTIYKQQYAAGRYEGLKEDLIICVSVSEVLRVCQHLQFEQLGDRKRTQFLGLFTNLAVPAVPAYIGRSRCTSRLPLYTKATNSPQACVTINDVALLAHITAEVTPPVCVPRISSSRVQISVLTAQTEELDK